MTGPMVRSLGMAGHSQERRMTDINLRCAGVGRNGEWPKSLLFYFNGVPTDDQIRYLHDVMTRALQENLPRSSDSQG